MKLTFCGGVFEVTGANYLLEEGNLKVLVDCGLHQSEDGEEKNFLPFPYNPSQISALFVTHAHIDHIGRIPRLFKEGFRGKVFSTKPTKDLALPMFLDAYKVMLFNSEKYGKEILYDEEDIKNVMQNWEGVDYNEKIKWDNLEVEFVSAGHILGAASILITFDNKKIVFSGDLGGTDTIFIQPFQRIKEANYVVMESTYGGRYHKDKERRKEILFHYVKETIRKKGILVIPAFALERTQELIFDLNDIVENKLKKKQKINVFVDGPLIYQIFQVYRKYSQNEIYFNKEAIKLQNAGDDIFNFPRLKMVVSEKESKEVLKSPPPKIIIAASGMSSGGRILFYELEYLKNPSVTFLMSGYQAKKTLGRRILEGEKKVKILDKEVEVKAKIRSTDAYSAHADNDDLIKWLSYIKNNNLKEVFLVQGDEEELISLKEEIKEKMNIIPRLPKEGESVIL
jgi:metallo-beta-lactamase family protein